MIDGNTAALERHLYEQDEAEYMHELYGAQALRELTDELMAERPQDAWEQYIDDPSYYQHQPTIERALAEGDACAIGRLVLMGVEAAARELLDDHDVAHRVWQLAEEQS